MDEKQIKIMLIEDNPGDVRLMQEMLKEVVQFKFDCSDRLSTGIELLGGKEFDVLILDLGLPDSQGIETLKKARANVSEIPIVVLTGLADEAIGIKAVQEGAQDYLIKGQIDSRLLVHSILYSIERKQIERALQKAHDELELLVEDRTAELAKLNDKLRAEIEIRKLAEEALRRSEEKYRTVADFTYDWEEWLDPNGKYIYVSPSCEWITGYRPDEFISDADVIKIVHPEDRGIVEKHFHEARDSMGIHHIDFRIINRDNTEHWVSHYCQPVYSKDGKFLGRRSSNRDVTSRKQREEEIQKLNKRLEQNIAELTEANKELDAFNYTVSHDLKAPLIIIEGFINRFLKNSGDKLDVKEKDMLGAIQVYTQNMEKLIKDLLAFSHSGRQQIKPAEIDMKDLITTVLEKLRTLSEGKMIKFDIKTLPTCYGDEALIKQVLFNLLSNAIKFTTNRKKAIIEVGSRIEGNENIYYVKDNGIGFDPMDLNKLFSLFQRLHGKEELEGTGVGLSIVQRIVNRHGGRVWAEGKVNEGATFYFSLPRKYAGHS